MGLVALVDVAGPPRSAQLPSGVTEVTVTLVPGAEGPVPGGSVPGRVVDLPPDGATVLAAAPVGHTYSLRFGTDGRWGGWIDLGSELDEGPDLPAEDGTSDPRAEGPVPTVVALGPVRVPDGADQVEIVLLSGGQGRVTLTFLADVDQPAATGPAGPRVKGIQVTAGATARPPIQPRSAWTTEGWATANAGCSDGPGYAERIQALVVHHTVTTNNYRADEADDLVRAVYYAHVRINKWCDVGYNFLIDRFGTIWEGRTGGTDLPVIGGHAKGFNSATVGVAMLGQHHPGASPSPTRPTDATATALAQLAAWKLSLHGVDPSGTTWLKNRSTDGPQKLTGERWHQVPTVMGHRDLGLTSCPGDYGLEVARGLIATLTAGRPAELPYVVGSWTPFATGPGFVTVTGRGGVRASGSATLPGMGEAVDSSPALQPLPSPPPVAVAVAGRGTGTNGWVLHGDGVLRPFGGAAPVAERPAGNEAAVDVVAGATGGWVVSAQAGVRGFGGRPDLSVGGTAGGAVIAGDLDDDGEGYLLDANGHLRPVGPVPDHQLVAGVVAVDVAVRPAGDSGWVLAADGRLHPFGDAPAVSLSAPSRPGPGRTYRAVVASGSGHGGWVATDDGQLWPFGNERLVLPVSTDVARADAVDMAVTAPVQAPSFLVRSDIRFVTKAGHLFLGRAPTAGEIDHWDGRFTYQGSSRLDASRELARTDEWAGARIDQLYQNVLGRPADDAGRRYWVGQVRAGLGLQQLGINFYGSAEYVLRSGSDEAYIQRLYQAVLERGADPAGLNYWVEQLRGGRARPVDVAAGFYRSVESRGQRVTNLYQLVLGRPPDPPGRAYWVERLLAVDDINLAAELAASEEFYLTP